MPIPWLPIAIGGSALLGFLGSERASSRASQAAGRIDPLTDALARIATERYEQLQPLEQDLIGRFRAFLGMPPIDQGPVFTGAETEALPDKLLGLIPELANAQGGIPPGLYTGQYAQPQPSAQAPGTMSPGGAQTTPGGAREVFSVDPSASPMYRYGKGALERQFATATDEIRATLPQGGGLLEALGEASAQKALGLAGMESNIAQDFFDKLYGMVSGAPQQAISGLGAAGGLAGMQANLAAQESARSAQALGGLGQGLGFLLAQQLMGAGGGTATQALTPPLGINTMMPGGRGSTIYPDFFSA